MHVLASGFGQQNAEWHVHEESGAGYCRTYYLTGGPIRYQKENTTRLLTAGHLYVFPSHAPFSLNHDPQDPLSCLWYHFDFFPAITEELIEIPINDSLQRVLDSLIAEQRSGLTSTGFYQSLVEALYCCIQESGLLTAPDPTLVEMLQAIRACYKKRDFSIGRISADLGYSAEHFIRIFKRHMHITPYHYASDLRLSEAARLLTDGGTVAETAEAVGYSESKVFARAFAQKYGMSPLRYRQHYRPIA